MCETGDIRPFDRAAIVELEDHSSSDIDTIDKNELMNEHIIQSLTACIDSNGDLKYTIVNRELGSHPANIDMKTVFTGKNLEKTGPIYYNLITDKKYNSPILFLYSCYMMYQPLPDKKQTSFIYTNF